MIGGSAAGFGFDLPSVMGGAGGEVYDKWTIGKSTRQWGVFDDAGNRILGAGMVRSVNLNKGYSITNAPQQDGAFISTGKTGMPYNATIQMICDGSETGSDSLLDALVPQWMGKTAQVEVRRDFMETLERIAANTKLYRIATPERTWQRANITGYSISKETTQWAYMTVANIMFQEVRSAASSGWVRSLKPQGAVVQHNGEAYSNEISD